MKCKLLHLLAIVLFAIQSPFSFAQTTITFNDLSNFYTIGNSYSTASEATPRMFDIGSAGTGNTWDFRGATLTDMVTISIVDPSTTPFTDDFPNATVATRFMLSEDGVSGESFNYLDLSNQAIASLGIAGSTTFDGTESTTISVYTPALPIFNFPISVGDEFFFDGTLVTTAIFGGVALPDTEIGQMDTSVVDASGTLIFPDGSSEEAIRVVQTSVTLSEIIPGFPTEIRSVTFSFVTKSGAVVSITAESESPPTEGMINGTITVTGRDLTVSSSTNLEALGYNLKAAYPNPFKDQTLVQYTLPEAAAVNVKVFNVNGQVVRQLENGMRNAGDHQTVFEKENLANGVYFIQLQAQGGVLTQRVVIGE